MKDFAITGSYTDLYQITMAQVYYLTGRQNETAVFDYFFRKLPFEGGYAIFAGLETVLDILENLSFTDDDIAYLQSLNLDKGFLESLKGFRFKGNIKAMKEGEIIFPNEPILRVEGNIIETQLIETLLLNVLNFQSLVATKAARIRSVAAKHTLSDFGLRRAQGLGAYHASRACVVGGVDSTSHVKAAMDFGVPAVGTMAHAFVQSYDDELTAFREFALHRPENCILLVDTYDTLKSGIPNAITVAQEMKERGEQLLAVRLDSGDLAYLSKQVRQRLDAAGLQEVKITASNQLDEWVIKSLIDQEAPIDIFGIGTSLITGSPDAALDGVYKLSYCDGKPRIKLSENIKKLTLPGKKQVYRLYDADQRPVGADVITFDDESCPDIMYHPYEPDKSLSLVSQNAQPMLIDTMINGKRCYAPRPLDEIARFCREKLAALPDEHKRFFYPHEYKVGVSEQLLRSRNELKNKFKKS